MTPTHCAVNPYGHAHPRGTGHGLYGRASTVTTMRSMKTRDSGMPGEDFWASFFSPDDLLRTLGLDQVNGTIIDVGCGYGTFTLPVARLTGQRVVGIDIEAPLIAELERRALISGLTQVRSEVRDVAANGLAQADDSAAAVLLFNLLHCEDPAFLLTEAWRVLAPGGRVGIIHWRSDVPTPRGPDLSIRPKPEAIVRWLGNAGFIVPDGVRLLPPYHFGLVGRKLG